ncbi:MULTISPECIES: guanylate kinase [Ignavibacterium]|uniref:guanylate kinase n=1 Tax=Ignavibacterium TaxID=795750 RepID=UPI0025BA4FCD|nr:MULTISPECIES: guanylate kinase [Ignavibacterium]MBI5660521.1 guanylate kinase [Ignavibacterium album]
MSETKGKIIVISSPSGGGKTTIVRKILAEFPEIVFSVSATTRPRRPDEIDGVHYFFLTEKEFEEKIKNNEFIEWERFYDYYYGTLKTFVLDNIKEGKTVLLEIDVKGALSVKKIFPDAVLIFIDVPSFEELVERLRKRKTESESDFKKRIDRAKMELSYKDKFDYIFVNKDLEEVTSQIKSLLIDLLKKEK